jgi:NH3-dependent NAD+ synthetase
MMNDKVILGWSGGKDSALALYKIRQMEKMEIAVLLTAVTQRYDRISMHGVRRELLLKQADALVYPLEEIAILQNCTKDVHEERMAQALEKRHQKGIRSRNGYHYPRGWRKFAFILANAAQGRNQIFKIGRGPRDVSLHFSALSL